MSLELLSNELLLDIFEYLSTVHLLQSFSTLNIRLTNLLDLHFRTHSCNFQSSSKYHFNLICHHYLPSIIDRITSLRLSDDDNTPNQIDHFYSIGLSIRQFIHLKSLSIHRFSSFNYWKTILNELPHLSQLIHLSITRYIILFNEEYDIKIIDCINRLSKLRSCHLDITNDNEYYFSTPAIHSSSLNYLSLPYLECTINQLLIVIEHLSNLQTLITRISNSSKTFSQLRLTTHCYSSIKIFKFTFDGSFESINNLLSIMPNIEILKINMLSSFINGYQWQNLIEKHLSKLKIFQFKMTTFTISKLTHENEINEILQSFQNSFWLEEHQWFVQCYYSTLKLSSIVYIYTLPYTFPDLFYLDDAQLKSTYSMNYSFNHVHNLYFSSTLSKQYSPIHLNQIRYLYLSFPIDHLLQTIVKNFNQLKTLEIILSNEINENDIDKLQFLFDQSKYLHSLILSSWNIQQIFPLKLKTTSIRYLDIRRMNILYSNQFYEQLTHSNIVQQCQILAFNLYQTFDILQLINKLNNLQSLIIHCQNSKLIEMMMEFLQANSFSPSITSSADEIRLWIR